MRKLICTYATVIALILMTNSFVLADVRPKIGKYAKVYKGTEGLYLTVLNIGPAENNESLFLIEGVDHPWDGKIMIAKMNHVEDRTEYSILVGGRDFITFVNRSGTGKVYLQSIKNPIHVQYHEERSQQVEPEKFLTRLLKQQNKP